MAKDYYVQHNVRATQEQSFILDGSSVPIEKGAKFHLFSSYKYPVAYFQNIACQVGLEPLDCFVHENQRMTLHILAPR